MPSNTASRNLERGGAIVLRLAQDFLRAFTGDPVETARSILALDLFLPLVRGAGVAARENLTQAEQDVLYALRSYALYQQEFVVTVASAFYRVVEDRDTLANEEVTYENLVRLYDRAKAFGPDGAGRLPDFEVDQARQNVLRADQRRVVAKEAFERSIDDLKIVLGLPISTEVVVREDAARRFLLGLWYDLRSGAKLLAELGMGLGGAGSSFVSEPGDC